jgi:hypothetical protein
MRSSFTRYFKWCRNCDRVTEHDYILMQFFERSQLACRNHLTYGRLYECGSSETCGFEEAVARAAEIDGIMLEVRPIFIRCMAPTGARRRHRFDSAGRTATAID